jgi:uncharacterized Zn finger protein (UPF0148 family)
MSNRSCPRCGSNSLRADRSLGGRIVCTNCGAPVGQGQTYRANQQSFRTNNRPWIWWAIGLGTLLIIIMIQSS